MTISQVSFPSRGGGKGKGVRTTPPVSQLSFLSQGDREGKGGWHGRPCPSCNLITDPYDDEPWPQGHEWTSAYDCTRCDLLWTHGWEYPSGSELTT